MRVPTQTHRTHGHPWVPIRPFLTPLFPLAPQSPAYTLVWTRQNHGTLPSRAMDFNGILTIRNVQPEDAGVYVCTGSNMLDMDEGTATLYVQGAFPSPGGTGCSAPPNWQGLSRGDPERSFGVGAGESFFWKTRLH